MNRRLLVIPLLTLFWSATALAIAPKVVKVTPENGATDVDPTLKQIIVEFDQPMSDGFSLVGGVLEAALKQLRSK
jgi:hypothetical protein